MMRRAGRIAPGNGAGPATGQPLGFGLPLGRRSTVSRLTDAAFVADAAGFAADFVVDFAVDFAAGFAAGFAVPDLRVLSLLICCAPTTTGNAMTSAAVRNRATSENCARV